MEPKINEELLMEMVGFKPHDAQKNILKNLKRFNPIECGRQFGKTMLVSYLIIRELLLPKRRIWIVAPNYNLTERVFSNYLMPIIKKYPSDFKVQLDKKTIVCKSSKSFVVCKSADNPVSLLGETLDLLVMDESAEVPEEVWTQYLRATLMVRRGKGVFISTPTTIANWFHQMYLNKVNDQEIASFHYTSYDNPYINKKELDDIKAHTPDRVWKNQYLAIPIQDGGTIFSDIKAVISGEFEDPELKKKKYVLGWDPAKLHDYSVFTVLDREKNHVVYYDRFSGVDWNMQIEKAIAVAHRYNDASIIIDSTGAGDPITEQLKMSIFGSGYGIFVYPFKISGSEKKKILIENLVVMIQSWDISYPKIPQLLDELETYTYTVTANGNVKYSAPHGMFDDSVISLALVAYFAKKFPYNVNKMVSLSETRRRTNYINPY